MAGPSFAAVFFRLYDRKIASGEITFSSTGIKKSDFTRLCVEPGYVFDAETIDRICETMHLTEEEAASLRNAASQGEHNVKEAASQGEHEREAARSAEQEAEAAEQEEGESHNE